MIKAAGRKRHDRDALVVQEKGIFVRAMRRAAKFDDAQPPRRDLIHDAVVQQDDAVGHIFFEPVPGEHALALLAGDECGDTALLEPAEEAAQFGAQDRLVREAGEQSLERIENDALGARLVDRVAETDEQTLEIVFTGFFDLAAFDADMIDRQFLRCNQPGHVESQRGDIVRKILGCLLEADEDAWLAEASRAVHQEGHAQQRLAAAGGAANQRRPASRESAEQDVVETGDSRRRLGELPRGQLGFNRLHPAFPILRATPSARSQFLTIATGARGREIRNLLSRGEMTARKSSERVTQALY